MGCGSSICWVLFGERGLVLASRSSWIQKDLLSALHVSLHLSSLVPTRIKRGWETDCNYQIGVSPMLMLATQHKGEKLTAPSAHH